MKVEEVWKKKDMRMFERWRKNVNERTLLRRNSINIYMHTFAAIRVSKKGEKATPSPVRGQFYNLLLLSSSLSVCLSVRLSANQSTCGIWPAVERGNERAENEYGNMEKSFGISADHTSLVGCPHTTTATDPSEKAAKSKVKYSINILNLHNLRKFQLVLAIWSSNTFSTSRIRVGVLSLVGHKAS